MRFISGKFPSYSSDRRFGGVTEVRTRANSLGGMVAHWREILGDIDIIRGISIRPFSNVSQLRRDPGNLD
jgi:hypothetical protein